MNWKDTFIQHLHSGRRFVRFVIKHFVQDECTYIASALAFTSLLAIVPLMSVSVALFSSLPLFQGLIDPVQDFVFDNFLPTTGNVVQTYLHQFASQVSKLSVSGLAFLVFTALLLLYTIEQAMNKIWRVSNPRRGVSAVLLYWAILSLTPLLLGLSLAGTSYFFSMTMWTSKPAFVNALHYLPFLLSLLGFCFLFSVVPNCPVKFRHAFWGALFAAILFEAAKEAFAYYLVRFNTYDLLYGAFATVPIFFIWIYWVWLITLLGAEISYALSVHHQRRTGVALDGFSHALLWLHCLWTAQQQAKGVRYNELIDASLHPYAIDVDEMIHTLTQSGLIHATADEDYRLTRNLSEVTLYDLTQLLPYRLPAYNDLQHAQLKLAEPWLATFQKSDAQLRKSLDVSVDSLFK